jgi:hypothetical protein
MATTPEDEDKSSLESFAELMDAQVDDDDPDDEESAGDDKGNDE